jgi:hypothetical protein
VDFTREPIVETVVTAREGCKLAIRNSKGVSQEEFFVDAVEVVSFGHAFFYRSLERPKNFLVPVSDYEVLEIRETRMVLKTAGTKAAKSNQPQKSEKKPEKKTEKKAEKKTEPASVEKPEKKRERRKSRRRVKSPQEITAVASDPESDTKKESTEVPAVVAGDEPMASTTTHELPPLPPATPDEPPSLNVAPPTQLISETLMKYKQDELYRGAFFTKEEVVMEVEAKEDEEGAAAVAPEDANA